jgi:hypothetical protein
MLNRSTLGSKKWHADDTDSLKRKRGFAQIFLFFFIRLFVISTQGEIFARNSTQKGANYFRFSCDPSLRQDDKLCVTYTLFSLTNVIYKHKKTAEFLQQFFYSLYSIFYSLKKLYVETEVHYITIFYDIFFSFNFEFPCFFCFCF